MTSPSATSHSSLLTPHFSRRRGSALLIVIGMVAFIIVSSVSFAIFMRQGRAPSSYLRRSANARYLLKAGLANAISRLDGCYATASQIAINDASAGGSGGFCEGVYDDTYPGVGQRTQVSLGGGSVQDGGYFCRRVFMPFGPTSVGNTVSTLTLEGLAYLPPAIINEVRIYSRQTRTAAWRHLSYDAGRYAFCAVDVSDCFDVNRLCAEERRLSSSGDRISFSSLFPEKSADLEKVLAKCSRHCNPGSATPPFVSVADFNVVAGAMGSPFAPFYKYVGTSGQAIYRANDADGRDCVSNALFVTDTWFPPTNTTKAVTRYDLEAEDGSGQPFKTFAEGANFLTPAKGPTAFNKFLLRHIGGVGMACLYDYLDRDSVPLSFVVPTVETAPMLVGLGLAHNGRFAPKVEAGATVESKEIRKDDTTFLQYKSTKYSLTKLMGPMVLSGVVAYPFKRVASSKLNPTASFTGEALIRAYFGPKNLRSRLAADSPLYPSKKDDWKTGFDRGVMTVVCPISGITFKGDVTKTEDAVTQFSAELAAPAAVSAPLFHFVEEYEIRKDEDGNTTSTTPTGNNYYSLDGVKDAKNAMVPRDADGKEPQWWTAATAAAKDPAKGGDKPQSVGTVGATPSIGDAEEHVPHVLVWVRLVSGGKTVDVVPARISDDGLWGASEFDAQGEEAAFGEGTPVLGFRGDRARAFKYAVGDADAAAVTKMLNGDAETFPDWTQLYALDPRYNYAPENWFGLKGSGDANEKEWLKAIGADGETATGVIGTDGRDRDIFMFTSDQEVLQSIGELAFLPNTQEMNGEGDYFDNDLLETCRTALKIRDADFSERCYPEEAVVPISDLSKFACGEYVWRTYTPVDRGDGIDPIYDLHDGSTPVEVVAGQGSFRVNPFSPDTRAIMAALLDTPFDYTVASDSDELNKTVDLEPKDREKFAFCEESAVAKMSDDELLDVAEALKSAFQSRASGSASFVRWEDVYERLAWEDPNDKCNDAQKSLFGLEDFDEPLHGVDRKFLFSFWRECFQNRQQLFLIFVRAEPLTVGGMGEGSLASAQLGARGVALVWRDPQPPAKGTRPARGALTSTGTWKNFYENCAPHRTRVLFYHQFD